MNIRANLTAVIDDFKYIAYKTSFGGFETQYEPNLREPFYTAFPISLSMIRRTELKPPISF